MNWSGTSRCCSASTGGHSTIGEPWARSPGRPDEEEAMPARRLSALSVALAVGLTGAGTASAHLAVRPAAPRAPGNVNVSRESGNQAEDAVAIQQTNPNNVVVVANEGSASALFHGWSTDGGRTWQTDRIADGDNLGTACCDPALAADNFGNIFLTWLASTGPVQVAI